MRVVLELFESVGFFACGAGDLEVIDSAERKCFRNLLHQILELDKQ